MLSKKHLDELTELVDMYYRNTINTVVSIKLLSNLNREISEILTEISLNKDMEEKLVILKEILDFLNSAGDKLSVEELLKSIE